MTVSLSSILFFLLIRDFVVRQAALVGWRRVMTAVLMSAAAFVVPGSRRADAQQAPARRPPQAQERQRPARESRARRAPAREPTPVEQRINAVETGLLPSVRIKGQPLAGMTLAARMKKYRVSGVSIAVVNDYAIEWARAYGTVDTGTTFRTGEVSQIVAALAALRVAQSRKLDLDRDVNKSLKSWKVPKSDLTKKQPVTLRALLTHTSGLTVTQPQAYDAEAKLPTIAQMLYGTPPATNPAIVSVESPGQSVSRSAGNYDALQLLLEDVTRQPYATYASDSVLRPLGMTHSTLMLPTDRAAQHAATGHDAAGKALAGKWRLYPELAAAGLWSTPSDLALMIVEIQTVSGGRPGKVLRPEFADQMVTTEHEGFPGLGVMLEGENESARFRASGATEGFEAALVGFVESGQGAVVMTNTAEGGALIEEILNAIASAYGWRKFVPVPKVVAKVDPKVFDRFVGRYTVDSREVSVAKRGNRLFIGPKGKESTELLPESVSEFFTADPSAAYSFVFDEGGKVNSFTQRQRGAAVRWDRKS